LTAREILTGKFLGSLQGVAFMATVPLITVLIGVFAGVFDIYRLSVAAIPCLVSVLLWATVGLRIGIRIRKPTTAVTATILIFVSSFAVFPALGNISQWVSGHMGLQGNPNLAIRSASPWVTVSHGVSSGLGHPIQGQNRFWTVGGGPPEAWAWFWIAAHGSLAAVLHIGAPRAMEASLKREAEDG
jgi:ABC-type transport system involved in multi-copper enzyme maturation permease subunit